MYEDPLVELEVFPAGARVFAIASAGCTSFTLANAGHAVTTVDINAAQVAYVRARLEGAEPSPGAADRLLAGARAALGPLGWTPADLDAFCEMEEPAEQLRVWDRRFDTAFRTAGAIGLRPAGLAAAYAPAFRGVVPRRFDRILRERLRRGWATHPNRMNPYARLLLRGEGPATAVPAGVTVHRADAAAYLESCGAVFDAFTLSNVLDGPASSYRARLVAAVRAAAAPGAMMVVRSFAEPRTAGEAAWAARDRSHLWGRIVVGPVRGERDA
jgi:S-adenosylmethionine:diacylglycerol 3-amino-3-carboxypropyl transferase